MTEPLDISANRRAPKWSRREQLGRALWAICNPAFALSPRPFWAWRRWILRSFGATVKKDVHIYPSVRITIPWNLNLDTGCAIGDRVILYALAPISIGPRSTVSQGVHVCAGSHDWRDVARPLLKRPINVRSDAWIAADAFIGPGVTIGSHAIVGARAVVTRDVPDQTMVAGNPARKIRSLEAKH